MRNWQEKQQVIQTEESRGKLAGVVALKLDVENKSKRKLKEPTIAAKKKVKEEQDLLITGNRSILLQKAKSNLHANTVT